MKNIFLTLAFLTGISQAAAYDTWQEAADAGAEAARKKDGAAALKAYQEADAKASGNQAKITVARNGIAWAYWLMRKPEKAAEIQKSVLELKEIPVGTRAHAAYMYAWYLQRERKDKESLEVIRPYLAMDTVSLPRKKELYDLFIQALVKQKRFAEAMERVEEMRKAGIDAAFCEKNRKYVEDASRKTSVKK